MGDPEEHELGKACELGALVADSLPGLHINRLNVGWECLQRFFDIENADAVAERFQLEPGVKEPVGVG